MFRYAQILHNKAHWIFESEETLEEMYLYRFSKEIVFVDITDRPEVQEGWNYDGLQFTDPNVITLDEAKTNKWKEIKTTRDKLEQAGVEYMGKVIDCDALAAQRITLAAQVAQIAISSGQEFIIDWTCADNSVLTMNAQELCGLPIALANQSNQLHQISRQLRQQIEEATTVDEVLAIFWPL